MPGRLRPTSVSGFPLAWLIIRMPCDIAFPLQEPDGLPKFLTLLSTHPTLFVDPGRPSGISPKRSLCVGFWGVQPLAICMMLAHGAVSRVRESGLPCGLRGSLCPLRRCCSAVLCLLHRCNTRYEWLVRPYSAGTCTLQEAPSFAWRTNARDEPLPKAGATQERTLEAVGCSALFGGGWPTHRRPVPGATPASFFAFAQRFPRHPRLKPVSVPRP